MFSVGVIRINPQASDRVQVGLFAARSNSAFIAEILLLAVRDALDSSRSDANI